ncbi:MAG: hypothetical protein GC200_12585 [Tepidisphaera sp.]|nr:hypothetical protein [Tepidisphaera sp.]
MLDKYNLSPADADVDLQRAASGEYSLVFTPASSDATVVNAFRRVIAAFGLSENSARLDGTYGELHAELVRVLHLLPDRRPFDAVDNVNTALMNKVVELADRYGINPCAFVAGIRSEGARSMIQFDMPPQDAAEQTRFGRMLAAVGLTVGADTPTLRGSDEELYDSLQSAIDRAPKARPR